MSISEDYYRLCWFNLKAKRPDLMQDQVDIELKVCNLTPVKLKKGDNNDNDTNTDTDNKVKTITPI